MSVEIREVKKSGAWAVYIDPFFDPMNVRRGHISIVSVLSQEEWAFEVKDHAWQKASVGWSSLGQIEPDRIEAFMKALTIAIECAKKMDLEHGFKVETINA